MIKSLGGSGEGLGSRAVVGSGGTNTTQKNPKNGLGERITREGVRAPRKRKAEGAVTVVRGTLDKN